MTAAPRLSEAEATLLARAGAWEECPEVRDCSPARLAQITREHTIEFATAVLYDRVLRDARHREFFEEVRACGAGTRVKPALVGIVPGAFYREHKRWNTGADGAHLAKILDCPVEFIPVESFGALERNASLIAEWLVKHNSQRVVLISLSKGSADLKLALGLHNAGELFKNVDAWVSISGLPLGTALVAWLRRQPLRRLGVRLLLWLRGHRYAVVEELRDEPGGPLEAWPILPPHLRVVHVVAVPLRCHLAHPWAGRGYERIAPLGPNDGGGFLLGNVINLPGTVYPVWGVDHYFQPAWDTAPTLRSVLARAMASVVEPRHANQ